MNAMVMESLNKTLTEPRLSGADRLNHALSIGLSLGYPTCPEIDFLIMELREHAAVPPLLCGPYSFSVGERWRHNKVSVIPKWANRERIKAIYAEAVKVRQETGRAVHVDHIFPINGAFVCGFHCKDNLAILPAIENAQKSNVTWPDMPDYASLSRSEFRELKSACERASEKSADAAFMLRYGNYFEWQQQRRFWDGVLREYCAVLDSWRSRTQKSLKTLGRSWDQTKMQRDQTSVENAIPHRLRAALAWASVQGVINAKRKTHASKTAVNGPSRK